MQRLAVQIGAVKAVYVDDLESLANPSEFGMAAADCGVIEEDVAGWMPTNGRDRLIKLEP